MTQTCSAAASLTVGLALQLTDQSIGPADAAREAEQRGFGSIWIGEHTHLPTDTVHRYTQGRFSGHSRPEGHVPEVYKRFIDPYIGLTAAAAATTSLRLGTLVALPAEHNPLILSKVISTLDMVSGGRFEWGIGFGWNPLETANNGVAFADRRAVLREKVLAMRRLWTEEVASFDGTHVQFGPTWSWPKPMRPPAVLLGAKLTASNIRFIVEFADGCLPVRAMGEQTLAEDLDRLRCEWEAAGREPGALSVSLVEATGLAGGRRSLDNFRSGLPSAGTVERYRSLGVGRLLLGVPTGDLDTYRRALDAIVAARRDWPVTSAAYPIG
ncbi:TIGR03619 family F420-dependent LLM class oxidoreductase [Mycolicibacterium elephantis]|uniref:TIGR03619 family F420-dependent LLM class oxidoreductase n=1 Tax=Mycolicibacterium elephantis TaxID=81858 RepID=UPI000FE1CCAF|nr:TIGR03619 family F420-dependent LLM class oxidoreductase [Mycolicibacterium elephantis]MCV7222094.1 TIGR03619 family F420-dependent LLM class oxidoreductase [Mycolicibacterium elephantis]